MITIKQMKEKHWNVKLKADDFARQVLIIDDEKDPVFKLWMQKVFHRFFESMGETEVRTIGEWSAELDSFIDHLLEHQPKPDHPNAYKLRSPVKLVPMENSNADNQ